MERLQVGDYSFVANGEVQLITRKSSDLWPSLYSSHFAQELQDMTVVPDARRWFILEGVWAGVPGQGIGRYERAGTKWMRLKRTYSANEQTLASLQVSVGADNVNLLWSNGKHMTIQVLASLYKKAQEGFKSSLRRPPRRKVDSPVASLMGLWPKLTEKQARALLECHSLSHILSLILSGTTEDLLTIKGIGGKTITNLTTMLEASERTTMPNSSNPTDS